MAHYAPSEYVILSLIFLAFIGGMVWYNLRQRAKAERLAHRSDASPTSIAVALGAEQRGDPK